MISGRRLLPLLIGLLAFTAGANPVVISHASYLASEDLKILVGPDASTFEGDYVFRSAPSARFHDEKSPTSRFGVTLWIPESAGADEPDLARFLSTSPSHALAWIKPETRPLVDRVVALSMKVGGRPLPYETFSLFHFGERGVTKEMSRPGALMVSFSEDFDARLLKRGARLQLAYRQPHLREGASRRLFYVPFFYDLPPGHRTNDPAKYRITIRSEPGLQLRVLSEVEHRQLSDGSILVVPEHQRPIEVEILPSK